MKTDSVSLLSDDHPEALIELGDMLACYSLDPETRRVDFLLIPSTMRDQRVRARQYLETLEILNLPESCGPVPANGPDSLVQIRVRGDAEPRAFAQGRTLRNSSATLDLQFVSQEVCETPDGLCIETMLRHAGGRFECSHLLEWDRAYAACTVRSEVRNTGAEPLDIEMLSSFSLGGITPFSGDDSPENLRYHRIRSAWCAEGRLESGLLEDLQLERSWCCYGVSCERFGQAGSMPVNGYFPFAAMEDIRAGVLWGVQLAHAASWQIEIYRKFDRVALSGGLADYEFGHWMKSLPPGGNFVSPRAAITCVRGDLDDLCHRLTSVQNKPLADLPASEHELGIMFNEWMCSWGEPTHAHIEKTCAGFDGTRFVYFVIDDGWAVKPASGIQQNGDWIVDRKKFPGGLKATCDMIRSHGLIPGLWFEFEACMAGTEAWEMTHLHLHRDGAPLQVGPRRFWDFRKPETIEHLSRKVIDTLRDNGFGYLKVDYNDTIGIGCDGASSPGEALREQVAGVQEFFKKIRADVPGIVIENCSSGGHRLEPSMMALCALGQFSDAHETPSIPILAANLHRVILPRQSQVWAVVREADTEQRLTYSLAATFLGRMCLSGDWNRLAGWQRSRIVEAQNFYHQCRDILLAGKSRRFGETGKSYTYPKGWQAVLRTATDGKSALLVIHTFEKISAAEVVGIPLEPGADRWTITRSFPARGSGTINGAAFRANISEPWQGCAYYLERSSS